MVRATTVAALETRGTILAGKLPPDELDLLRRARFTACVACTDVHEYGKLLVEAALRAAGVGVVDAGVSADPDVVAREARDARADLIAISTYNGVALSYLRSLRHELGKAGLDVPVFVGGKLNQVPDDGLASIPRDVTAELRALGAVVCLQVEDMLHELVRNARSRERA